MGFDTIMGFQIISTPDNMVDYVECQHCGETVFDHSVDVFKSVKKIVNYFVAHLAMFHPDELPPELIDTA